MTGCYGVPRFQFLQGIEEAARWAVKAVIAKANEVGFDLRGRSGGYFCFLEKGYVKLSISPTLMGEVTNGKDAKYRAFCQEKVERLLSKYLHEDHELSSQSRDESKEQYGGAVYVGSPIEAFCFGFSGLPEVADEAAMLLVAAKSGCISLNNARELAQISENSFFLENDWDLEK